MISLFAVLIAAVSMIVTLSSQLRTGARRDGKIDAAIEQLTTITGDHEARIRTLETGRHRRR